MDWFKTCKSGLGRKKARLMQGISKNIFQRLGYILEFIVFTYVHICSLSMKDACNLQLPHLKHSMMQRRHSCHWHGCLYPGLDQTARQLRCCWKNQGIKAPLTCAIEVRTCYKTLECFGSPGSPHSPVRNKGIQKSATKRRNGPEADLVERRDAHKPQRGDMCEVIRTSKAGSGQQHLTTNSGALSEAWDQTNVKLMYQRQLCLPQEVGWPQLYN